jgi:hypothetical protein
MLPTGFFAVAVGVLCLVLIAVISMRGPRDPGGRLPGNGGPMFPYDDGADGK